ncbi:MAG: dienelactone hydrolase family protein [Cyanobacteria bacterium J06641_5]
MRKGSAISLITMLMVLGCAALNPIHSNQVGGQPQGQVNGQEQSQQIAELHKGDRPIASPFLVGVGDLDVTAETVTYSSGGEQPFTGYLAQPTESSPDRPGLIVIQEWWGLNDNIKAMTRLLAAKGYKALAVDLYDGEVAETRDAARSLVQKALEAPERLEQNTVAAYNYLTQTLNTPTVGSIGWCFGGTWSLNTALALPDGLDAAVIYYGGGIVTERDRLSTLQMPIQGHFGALDTRPSPETVAKFEATLNDLGKTAEIYVYEGADHAFANPSGTRYNAKAAELAWERTVTFLDEHL